MTTITPVGLALRWCGPVVFSEWRPFLTPPGQTVRVCAEEPDHSAAVAYSEFMRGAGDQFSVGDRIAFYRRRRGLTQRVLAQLVGRSEDWLSKIERNEREIRRLDVLGELAKALQSQCRRSTRSARSCRRHATA